MKNLSELLKERKRLINEWELVNMWDESDVKDTALTNIDVALDCLEVCLMYGDYINDTGEDFDYYNM